MDAAVRDYIDGIDPGTRPLFDRIHNLILEVQPDAELVISYQIPTYRLGRRRLFVGAWKHGLSIYGWDQGHDSGFAARHPRLMTGKATLRLRPVDAADIPDNEFRELVRSSLKT